MAQIQQATGQLIARAIATRAKRGAFGVLVRDMPEYDPAALLLGLGESRSRRVALRIAMPGFAQAQVKALNDTARRAGFDEDSFVTTVEGAERWRNNPDVDDTIVVVTTREIPKLN